MAFPLVRVLDPITEPVCLSDMKNYLRVDMSDDDPLIETLISVARERVEDFTSRSLLTQQWRFSFDRFPGWFGEGLADYSYFDHHHHHSMFRKNHTEIVLPRGPVLSVDSITYKSLDTGTVVTLDESLYEVDLDSAPARITPIYNGCWPVAQFDTNSVVVTFTAAHEQTVNETVTVGAAAPFSVTLKRQTTALSLTSAVDATSGAAVSATMTNGVLTFTGVTPGQSIKVVYQTSSIPKSLIMALYLMVGAWYELRAEVVQGGGNFNELPTPISATSLMSTYKLFQVGYPRS